MNEKRTLCWALASNLPASALKIEKGKTDLECLCATKCFAEGLKNASGNVRSEWKKIRPWTFLSLGLWWWIFIPTEVIISILILIYELVGT